MKNNKSIWLVTTDALEDGLWFREFEDFKVGMNYVAVQAALSGIVILAFILMSNHVHFVLVGSEEEVRAFVNDFKTRYGRYLQRKYGLHEFLRRNKLDLREIPLEDEALERAIAYVQMNSVAANICTHPVQYPWGSGGVFFNSSAAKGKTLGSMSVRSRRRLLHCAVTLPCDWILGEEGYILPSCYLNVKYVESLFGTPRRMNYFLQTSSKARKRIETGPADLPAFRDQTILGALSDLYRTVFGKSSFEEMSEKEQAELLRQIRFRFNSDVNQISRVIGITYEAAARLLDSY